MLSSNTSPQFYFQNSYNLAKQTCDFTRASLQTGSQTFLFEDLVGHACVYIIFIHIKALFFSWVCLVWCLLLQMCWIWMLLENGIEDCLTDPLLELCLSAIKCNLLSLQLFLYGILSRLVGPIPLFRGILLVYTIVCF